MKPNLKTHGPGRPLLVTGSEAERLGGLLRERGSSIPVRTVSVDELAGAGQGSIRILSPGDDAEFLVLAGACRSAGVPAGELPVVSSTCLRPPADGCWMIFREGSFTTDILMNLPDIGIPASGPSSLFDFLTMVRNGVLLPFFIHNINNILVGIMGSVELAGYHMGSEEKLQARIRTALESTEDLRQFVSDLSLLADNSGGEGSSRWSPACALEVFEAGRMSTGTSVKFDHFADDGKVTNLPVSRNQLNSLLGAVSAASTLFVNGCGSVHIALGRMERSVRFSVSWDSTSVEGSRSIHQSTAAVQLLAWAARLSTIAGATFLLERWTEQSGCACLVVRTGDDGSIE